MFFLSVNLVGFQYLPLFKNIRSSKVNYDAKMFIFIKLLRIQAFKFQNIQMHVKTKIKKLIVIQRDLVWFSQTAEIQCKRLYY